MTTFDKKALLLFTFYDAPEQARPVARPNRGFWGLLMTLEEKERGEVSVEGEELGGGRREGEEREGREALDGLAGGARGCQIM